MGEAPSYATLLANVAEGDDVREVFSDDVLAMDGVKTVTYNDETINSYRSMLKSVDSVVVVLVVAAALLAFVVLYNLTNINITERVREIATLKVLGFTPHEVNAYIYRETMLLSLRRRQRKQQLQRQQRRQQQRRLSQLRRQLRLQKRQRQLRLKQQTPAKKIKEEMEK